MHSRLCLHSTHGRGSPDSSVGAQVGGNSGCASLLKPNRTRHRTGHSFGIWCDATGDAARAERDSRSGARSVFTVPLRQLLEWIGRPVDFVKIDAQGMDLEIVASGGAMLRNVRRVLLEVISDDCRPVYESQPRCSEVVSRMATLGFVPLTPLPCVPPKPRPRANHRCELEYVFRNAREGVTAHDTAPTWFSYHQGFFNWCSGSYSIRDGHPRSWKPGKLPADVPEDSIVATIAPHGGTLPAFYSFGHRQFPSGAALADNSYGSDYLCPDSCFPPRGREYANKTHLMGVEWPDVMNQRIGCPFW